MSIPLTILGGFLGAGKTTALNRLLREATGRIGVLVNDFGAINVDAALIAAAGGDVMQLTNGCVCCAVGPDLSDSLARLVALAPDRIVVEASGVADPWRLAQVARLQPGVALDAVLVLADATAFTTHLADPWLADTLARQVQRADLVALSKCDTATPSARAATAAALRRLRPTVRVVELADGMLPGLLMLGAAPGSRLAADDPGHGFRSWHWADKRPLDGGALRRVLAGLPSSVVRAKGLCAIGAEAEPHLLQLAGARWTLTAWAGPVTAPGLVLVGTPELPCDTTLAALFEGAVCAAPAPPLHVMSR